MISDRLKLARPEYHFNELTPPPENVARLDEAYKGINKILDHKFANKRKFKTDLLLHIFWDDVIAHR